MFTRLPVPLPTGGCASAACRMVHTISSIRALSCLSDSTEGSRGEERMRVKRSISFWCCDFWAKMKLLIVKLYPTLLSLHGLLQQEFSHALPVFKQLLRAFPQRVHQVSSVFVQLHAGKEELYETLEMKL